VELRMEVVNDPAEPFATAALELAPFVLPTVPLKVSQFWTFKPETGDLPTLPVVAFQYHVLEHYPAFRALLQQGEGGRFAHLPPTAEELLGQHRLVAFIQELRAVLSTQPAARELLRSRLQQRPLDSPTVHRTLSSLLTLYSGGHSRYLKYYGPPQTIEPIPYHRVLEMTDRELERFHGKVVFIGVSAASHWDQEDIFYTAYPGPGNAFYISGVEVAATAFGNLLEGSAVEPLAPIPLMIWHLLWGIGIGLLARLLPAGRAIPVTLLLALGYSLAVYWAFVDRELWLPWVVPLFVQALPALFLGLWLGYREASHGRAQIATALNRYLPDHVARELAGDLSRSGTEGQLLQGVCMATDAEQYTTLAERLPPQVLSGLLNDYYQVIFEPIQASGGFVSDVVGDAALGLWMHAREDDSRLDRERSCGAALDILAAVEAFNHDREHVLPIRIGLHFGEVYVGDVGAGHHFEYRAVGDIVNTATRIEQAAKQLGVRVLVSGDVLGSVPGYVVRDLGLFQLAGKRRPVHLFELMARTGSCPGHIPQLLRLFEQARTLLLQGDWGGAWDAFVRLAENYPDDGPTRFFLQYCKHGLAGMLESEDTRIVRLQRK